MIRHLLVYNFWSNSTHYSCGIPSGPLEIPLRGVYVRNFFIGEWWDLDGTFYAENGNVFMVRDEDVEVDPNQESKIEFEPYFTTICFTSNTPSIQQLCYRIKK